MKGKRFPHEPRKYYFAVSWEDESECLLKVEYGNIAWTMTRVRRAWCGEFLCRSTPPTYVD